MDKSPELIDAVAISTLGDYPSNTIEKAIFIPPASPAKKTLGVVTVNTTMSVCSIETMGKTEYEKN